MSQTPIIVVVTAAVVEREGSFLLTRRLMGSHLEGFWEFPGGKCHQDETLAGSLVREIREELDAGVAVGPEILATKHHYPDRTIELHFFECTLTSEPRPALGQEMRWVPRADLASLPMPAADDELVKQLLAGTL